MANGIVRATERGEEALDWYVATHDQGEPPLIALTDLLTDLMHAASWRGVEFERALRTAQMHFEEECLSEGGELPRKRRRVR